MKYLCLVYGVEERFPGTADMPADTECVHYAESLAESGRLLAGEALAPAYTATTVMVRNHQVSVTDGVFSSGGSPLVGFYLVTARDLNEAIHLASEIPLARIGCVEIRPVRGTL
ncbi:YciI family protein [Aestuariicella sp. G3-2]|uniref:YciI family protein n=1 Tax=Pseudomaricurvus albidus TaxID=2842452 RepID=UPI001C0D512D|nr:YciI family protein [Aestuariicella albida]MBU3068247.1 YciI family protein [Aestuariicella albida]